MVFRQARTQISTGRLSIGKSQRCHSLEPMDTKTSPKQTNSFLGFSYQLTRESLTAVVLGVFFTPREEEIGSSQNRYTLRGLQIFALKKDPSFLPKTCLLLMYLL